MALSCFSAVVMKVRQPRRVKKSSTSATCSGPACWPGVRATGRSASASGLGPKRGWVPTTGPGQMCSIWRMGCSFTEVMSASTARAGRCGHTAAATSPNTAAGTHSMAISAPAQDFDSFSGVRGTSTPTTSRPAAWARAISMAPMRPREPIMTVLPAGFFSLRICVASAALAVSAVLAAFPLPVVAARVWPCSVCAVMPASPRYSRIAERIC